MDKAEKTKESWQERKTKIKRKWYMPFIYMEWRLEQLSYLLGQWALIDILVQIGRLGILVSIVVGVYVYVTEADERRMQVENQRKANQYQAWQVINAAQGKPGNLGRTLALQDLHRDGISLGGVDISKAYIPHLNLEDADLNDTNLSEAILSNVNLAGATLIRANLRNAKLSSVTLIGTNLRYARLASATLIGVNLRDANFSGANLYDTNLIESDLSNANVAGVELTAANLAESDLSGANLARATLINANLAEVDLHDANLAEADLRDANLTNIKRWQHIKSIKYANIFGVRNPPDGFVEWAKENGAVSIETRFQWEKFKSEKKKQKAGNSRGDQKKVR